MTYQIRYHGTTGDSETTKELDGVLELEWTDKEVARANLERIAAHYELYKQLNDSWEFLTGHQKSNQELIEEHKDCDWIVLDLIREGRYKGEYNETSTEMGLKLYTDSGKVWQISAPWCGYFESLGWVEIITIDNGIKIEF